MAFTKREDDFHVLQLEQFMETHRPPREIRDELDLGYKIEDQSIELFEIRTNFVNPTKKINSAVAKATFVRKIQRWKIFWMRQDMKWHLYPHAKDVQSIEEFLQIVTEDKFGCFFG